MSHNNNNLPAHGLLDKSYLSSGTFVRQSEHHTIHDTYKTFIFNSLLIKEEAVKALQKINSECLQVLDMHLFETNFANILDLEQFRGLQDARVTSVSIYVKERWL